MKVFETYNGKSVLVKMKLVEWEALREFAWNFVNDEEIIVEGDSDLDKTILKIANV